MKNNIKKIVFYIKEIIANNSLFSFGLFIGIYIGNKNLRSENNQVKPVIDYNVCDLPNKKQIENKTIKNVYQNFYLLENFHKNLIQPFLKFLIRNVMVILYGDLNAQRHLKDPDRPTDRIIYWS